MLEDLAVAPLRQCSDLSEIQGSSCTEPFMPHLLSFNFALNFSPSLLVLFLN